MIRKAVGGTWLKVKTSDNKGEYWVRPSNPTATEALKQDQVIDRECYGSCLFRSQNVTTF